MFSLAIWNTCSPVTLATFLSSGTASIRRCTPTVADWYPTVAVLDAPVPAIVPPVARITTLGSLLGSAPRAVKQAKHSTHADANATRRACLMDPFMMSSCYRGRDASRTEHPEKTRLLSRLAQRLENRLELRAHFDSQSPAG